MPLILRLEGVEDSDTVFYVYIRADRIDAVTLTKDSVVHLHIGAVEYLCSGSTENLEELCKAGFLLP